MWGPVTRKVAVTDIWHPPCLRDRLPCNGFRSGGLNALPKCVKSRAKELPQTMAYYLR